MSSSKYVSRKEAHMSWDLGSTALRVTLAVENAKEPEIVPNSKTDSTSDTSRYEPGCFGGYINLSEGTEVYTGENVPNATQVPAKLILSKGWGIDENNPLLTEVRLDRGPEGNAKFERRCQEGLQALAEKVAEQVKKRCNKESEPLIITRISLTVPAHWTTEQEEDYRALIQSAFPISRRRDSWLRYSIYFMTEIEGFAHFFFHDPDDCQAYLGDKPDNYVLFLDFGGHSMNGCLYLVRRIRGKFAFYRVRKPFGAIGGSAQWEAAVGDFCARNALLGESSTTIHPGHQTKFQKCFREKLRGEHFHPYKEINLSITPSEENAAPGDILSIISAAQSRQFFDDATREPLELAKKEIDVLASYKGFSEDAGVRILVSGGTAKNKTVQEMLDRICSKARLPPPHFVTKEFRMNE
ncbi:hypothetical protein LY78DRAFT_674871 [Colletotrichum sublineola]|nr:hypothetical protein LY78DRAFT_674871 [Colletotrichum sublineola]